MRVCGTSVGREEQLLNALYIFCSSVSEPFRLLISCFLRLSFCDISVAAQTFLYISVIGMKTLHNDGHGVFLAPN